MADKIFSTQYVYFYLQNDDLYDTESIILRGRLRTTGVWPRERDALVTQSASQDFYRTLYDVIGKPVIEKPYAGSGVFLSPIDFRRLNESRYRGAARFAIPISRLDHEWSVLTYMWNRERIITDLTSTTLLKTQSLWTAATISRWTGVDAHTNLDRTPLIAAYQPWGVPISSEDYQPAARVA